MPTSPTYPGVYIEELPSGVRTISGVATSIAAFVGRAKKGPVNEPTTLFNYGEFERTFGGLWLDSTMSYAVRQFYDNGGGQAIIVRVHDSASAATLTMNADSASETMTLEAANVGAWGNNLQAIADHDTLDDTDTTLFNLTIREVVDPSADDVEIVNSETFFNLSTDPDAPRYVELVLEQESKLARVSGSVPSVRLDAEAGYTDSNDDGVDGSDLAAGDIYAASSGESINALDQADVFNLLCLPPPTRTTDWDVTDWEAAMSYCKSRRAVLLVDAPASWSTASAPVSGLDDYSSLRDENVAMYFPRLKFADALKENRAQPFAPSGAVAGVIARTDGERGIWKAPAGIDARIIGAREMVVRMTNDENGQLNPLGLNCLRTMPVVGNVVWGARTLEGADRLSSDWKYLPVRRLALYIEESLFRGTQWVVFEPNDEPLWSQIRLNVGSFMNGLFRQGAFKGSTPKEAYLVKCDSETTTQDDINKGIVNILVGFAPLKPAEFVIIKLKQLAGQVDV